jgi:hypothetical protein
MKFFFGLKFFENRGDISCTHGYICLCWLFDGLRTPSYESALKNHACLVHSG